MKGKEGIHAKTANYVAKTAQNWNRHSLDKQKFFRNISFLDRGRKK